jgi:hypothetical protein
LCLSKVVRALFLINDAKVQKIFQTTKYFSYFFNQKAKIFWLFISCAKNSNSMAQNFTDFAQISTISFPVLTTTPHAARRNFSVIYTLTTLFTKYYILLYIIFIILINSSQFLPPSHCKTKKVAACGVLRAVWYYHNVRILGAYKMDVNIIFL